MQPEHESPEQIYRVMLDYTAIYTDPIKISAGDELITHQRESEWSGWVWCTNAHEKEGWVPEQFLERSGERARATVDYDATELTVHAGEHLRVEEEVNGWFWCTNEQGQSGWVPVAVTAPAS
jgi:uncharacterized protein YgiM (DUF1202 family)